MALSASDSLLDSRHWAYWCTREYLGRPHSDSARSWFSFFIISVFSLRLLRYQSKAYHCSLALRRNHLMLWELPLVVQYQARSLRCQLQEFSSLSQASRSESTRTKHTPEAPQYYCSACPTINSNMNPSCHIPILLIPINELSTALPRAYVCQ